MRFLGYRARRNDAEWPFHSKELQRSHVPQKTRNPPRSELTEGQVSQKIFGDHSDKLKNERSTAGFRFIQQCNMFDQMPGLLNFWRLGQMMLARIVE